MKRVAFKQSRLNQNRILNELKRALALPAKKMSRVNGGQAEGGFHNTGPKPKNAMVVE